MSKLNTNDNTISCFTNLIKIRSTHLLPIFYLFFFVDLILIRLLFHNIIICA